MAEIRVELDPDDIERIAARVAELMRMQTIPTQRVTLPPSFVSDEWMSRKEYARKYSVSVSTVDRLIRDGKLETIRLGRRVLIKAK